MKKWKDKIVETNTELYLSAEEFIRRAKIRMAQGWQLVPSVVHWMRPVPEPAKAQECPSPGSIASEDEFGTPAKPPVKGVPFLSEESRQHIVKQAQSKAPDIGKHFEGGQ